MAAEHHYPMIAAGASNPIIWQQGNQYVFALQATAGGDYLRGALEMARQEGLSKIAMLGQGGEGFTGAILRGTRNLLLEYDDMELVYQGVYEYEQDENGQKFYLYRFTQRPPVGGGTEQLGVLFFFLKIRALPSHPSII